MQYYVYHTVGGVGAYPYLLDVQSDIIDNRKSRIVIPLMRCSDYGGPRATQLNPMILLDNGTECILMTHALAGVPIKALGEVVCSVIPQRDVIKSSIDFVFDGF